MAERQFKTINVEILLIGPPSRTIINWEWEESVLPLSRYKLDIYRGESPEEMEKIVSDLPAEMYSEYEDNTARLITKQRTYHYLLVAKNCSTGKEIKSNIVTYQGFLDKVGLYVVEEHEHLFRFCTGSPTWVLKKQTDGMARCEECWDKIRKRIKRSDCTTCHGTGFVGRGVGGYYNPTYTWVDYHPDPEIIEITAWGRTEGMQTDIFMSNYPRLTPGDIVIELLGNKRWKVVNVRDTEKRRVKMLQISRLDLIDPDEVEYQIDVPKEIIERARTEMNASKREREF